MKKNLDEILFFSHSFFMHKQACIIFLMASLFFSSSLWPQETSSVVGKAAQESINKASKISWTIVSTSFILAISAIVIITMVHHSHGKKTG